MKTTKTKRILAAICAATIAISATVITPLISSAAVDETLAAGLVDGNLTFEGASIVQGEGEDKSTVDAIENDGDSVSSLMFKLNSGEDGWDELYVVGALSDITFELNDDDGSLDGGSDVYYKIASHSGAISKTNLNTYTEWTTNSSWHKNANKDGKITISGLKNRDIIMLSTSEEFEQDYSTVRIVQVAGLDLYVDSTETIEESGIKYKVSINSFLDSEREGLLYADSTDAEDVGENYGLGFLHDGGTGILDLGDKIKIEASVTNKVDFKATILVNDEPVTLTNGAVILTLSTSDVYNVTIKFECIKHDFTEGTCENCGLECEHANYDEDHDCKVCDKAHDNPSHDYDDGVCTICEIECVHVWKNGVCRSCTYECDHENGEDDGGNITYAYGTDHICPDCESKAESTNHDYDEDGICEICGLSCTEHDWSNLDGTCDICGVECTHEDVKDEDGNIISSAHYGEDHICVTCGSFSGSKKHVYSEEDGLCETCGLECVHNWSRNECTVCSFTCTHEVEDGFAYGEDHNCLKCKSEAESTDHDYDDKGICIICGLDENACTTHDYVANEDGTHSCSNCDIAPASHVDANTDNKCDDCDADMTVPCDHAYVANEDGTHSCSKCDIAPASHVDANTDNKCDDCDADMTVPCDHSNGWVNNNNAATHKCKDCVTTDNHTFDGDICSVCGYDKTVAANNCNHNMVKENDDGHICNICWGDPDKGFDNYAGGAWKNHTFDANGKCTVCGYTKPPKEGDNKVTQPVSQAPVISSEVVANVAEKLKEAASGFTSAASATNAVASAAQGTVRIDAVKTGGFTTDILKQLAGKSSNKNVNVVAKYAGGLNVTISNKNIKNKAALEALDFTMGKSPVTTDVANKFPNAALVKGISFKNSGDLGGVDSVKVAFNLGKSLMNKNVDVYSLVDGKLVKIGKTFVDANGNANVTVSSYDSLVFVVN